MKLPLTILTMFLTMVVFANDPADSTQRRKVASRPWYVPDYVPLQYSGNIGWLSAGAGFATRRDNYQLSLVYGYSPPSVSMVPVHLLTARNIFHLKRFEINGDNMVIPYVAASVSGEVGGNSFYTVPSNMPDEYYHFPKAIHLIPAIGVKHRHLSRRVRGLKGVEIFGEVSTVDAYLYYKLTSSEVKLTDICSFSFGIHILR